MHTGKPTGEDLSKFFNFLIYLKLSLGVSHNNPDFWISPVLDSEQGSHFFPLTKFPDFPLTFPVFFSFFPDFY